MSHNSEHQQYSFVKPVHNTVTWNKRGRKRERKKRRRRRSGSSWDITLSPRLIVER